GVQYILDGNDYLEFYAEKNSGYLDESLYNPQQDQPNEFYSLFNDTAIYYLTWNNSIGNARMGYEIPTDFSGYTQFPYFYKEVVQSYTSGYYLGETVVAQETDPDYTKAEGWFDAVISSGGSSLKTFATDNA